MAPFVALYGWRCHSPIGWFDPGKAKLYGTDLVKDALERVNLIQERFCTAQSRQKSNADQKAHNVSFMVGEKVLLKVLPMKDIMRFGKKGKLSPRYHTDLSHVLDFSTIQLYGSLGCEEELVAIIDRQDCQLRSKRNSAAERDVDMAATDDYIQEPNEIVVSTGLTPLLLILSAPLMIMQRRIRL
ncbi:uncharacterized protein [Nicotiana sylvestris]|uniref:uncharacterized protein n=1 Tax=Nicotiana sylvestris TaxID=4096 RepID=UPI00388CA5E5